MVEDWIVVRQSEKNCKLSNAATKKADSSESASPVKPRSKDQFITQELRMRRKVTSPSNPKPTSASEEGSGMTATSVPFQYSLRFEPIV